MTTTASVVSSVARGGLLALTVLGAAVCAAWMVGLAPGASSGVHELDIRLTDRSIESLRAERDLQQSIWIKRLLRGDLGDSQTYGRPIGQLLAERLPPTATLVAQGLLLAWASALVALIGALTVSWGWLDGLISGLNGAFLSLPSALLAILCLHLEWPGSLAVAAVVFPRLYCYLRSLADRELTKPHVLAALARGVPWRHILTRHVLARIAPVALTMSGVSLSIALGAVLPIEAICDLPGIGQIAWEAALTRDLPLIVALTIGVTVVTATANTLSDVAAAMMEVPN